MIQQSRICDLNKKPIHEGSFVLYWMQQSQRAEYNHALEFAIDKANELHQPLLVLFVLTDSYPDANVRHYTFMVNGIIETRQLLEQRGIRMIVRYGDPIREVISLSNDVSIVITDRGYTRIQRVWRKEIAEAIGCQCVEIDSDTVVPVTETSDKEEFAARTIRPKIQRKLSEYIVPLSPRTLHTRTVRKKITSLTDNQLYATLKKMSIDNTVKPVRWLEGGSSAAHGRLGELLAFKLDHFAIDRNDPSKDFLSHLSPYLQFRQLSSLEVALEVSKTKSAGKSAFLEELIVRRELAVNYVWYSDRYDSFDGLPEWAKRTLTGHNKDKRSTLYSLKQLETAKTHDSLWNTAQREMIFLGKMHGYMRMYWGKKIMEWTSDIRTAYEAMLYLNNKYFIDGRDANGYTGVAWCFGKHDRAFAERPIFGKIRYMNDAGLKRKFDTELYVKKVEEKIRKEM